MILHIPHSSVHVPDLEGYVDVEKMVLEINKFTDWYTDELFDVLYEKRLVTPFSRVFCDVERFEEDADEPMARKGMGLAYTLRDDGTVLRNVSSELRRLIVEHYYKPHHQQLEDLVQEELATKGYATIIDCHSYTNTPFIRDQNQDMPRPDINIGTDFYHTPKQLVTESVAYFKSRGFTVGVDWPYSGSIVPMRYYKRDKRVRSIMLEVNRDLYLRPGTSEKNNRFEEIKELIGDWLGGV